MSDAKFNAVKHNHCANGKESPTYRSWKAMKRRCGNPSFGSYVKISYDPEWKSFACFLRDMGERPCGTTLDRIDGLKGYSKDNCRWSTRHEQNQNRNIVVLSRQEAESILKLKHASISAAEVASQFGCSTCNVNDIWAGRSWSNLK